MAAPPSLPAQLPDQDGRPDVTPGPGPPTPPPLQPSWAARAAALQSEYVSGGGTPWLSQYLRSLPHQIDDATRDFGDELYDRMLQDGQVSSAIRLLKESALESGVRLEPAIAREPGDEVQGDEELSTGLPARDQQGRWVAKKDKGDKDDAAKKAKDADFDLAEEITDFCEDCLLHLERPLIEVLYEMLDAVAVGNKVAEQLYKVRKDGDEAPRLHLRALKVKPRKNVAFVVNAFMDVVGIMGHIPGLAYPVISGSMVVSPGQIPNMLPRDKFAVFTWASHNNDPRGSSLLRQVYNPWYMKLQTWAEYAKYLVKLAGPSLIGYTAPNAQPTPPTDSLGNPIPGVPLITPEQAMLNALLNFGHGSAAVFAAGSKVEPLQMPGDGAAYRNAVQLYNQEITKGIMCQTLATETAGNMSRAASETHQQVLDIVVLHIKALLACMIHHDILIPLVRYNWGEDVARRLTPKVHLAQIAQRNWATDAGAVASLVSSQYLDRSQFREMDARLGLPVRAAGQPMPAGPPQGGGMPGAPTGPNFQPPRQPQPAFSADTPQETKLPIWRQPRQRRNLLENSHKRVA